jgi:hypothetical protein
LEHVEVRTPVHLAFDEFQFFDLAFGQDPSDHGSVIAARTADLSLAIPAANDATRVPLSLSASAI